MPRQTKKKNATKCGMVSIVGRPNVGKSTLLNKIVDEKVAIVSKIPQTTRNQVRGVYTDERGQIVFIDTPGLHRGRDKLDSFMNRCAYATTDDVDCIIHLVDANDQVGKEEEVVVKHLSEVKVPVIMGLNKIDLKGRNVSQYVDLWEETLGKSVNDLDGFAMIPLSGEKGKNVEKLIDLVFERLPEGPLLYPEDIVTDIPQKMAMADIIREKLFQCMRQEVPHAVAVVIEETEPRKNKVLYIRALIIVEKPTQKEMVIGKKGLTVKRIGVQAREELEQLLEKKVFLEIFVKAKKNWRDDVSLLQEMGYEFA